MAIKNSERDVKYYDWQKMLSYDADVTIVVGAHGCGKTFALRRQCIADYNVENTDRMLEVENGDKE